MGAPFYFGPDRAPLLGWWHAGCPTSRRGVAVVLCPPIGFEYNSVYRSFRNLAVQLAKAGFDVIRFDYAATGDSSGTTTDPGQTAGWISSIREAIAAATRMSNCDSVALVGARFGGTLAAAAAAEMSEVESMVLWSPFRSGKTFVREVRALDAMSGANDPTPGPDLSAAGYILTPDTVADLARIDLLAVERIRAERLLVIERDDLDSDRKLLDHLGVTGPQLSVDRTAGTSSAFVEGAQTAAAPVAIMNRITEWLVGAHPVRAAAEATGPKGPAVAVVSPGCRERPVTIEGGPPLFGIVSEPDRTEPAEAAVVFLNTGAGYHIGPHRMFVPLARQLAAAGFLVYRFDIQGLGDSATPESGIENVAYPSHAVADVKRAVEAIRRETGVPSVALVGLCSGGWHAVRAVRDGLAIDGLLAINPPLYYDRDEQRSEVLGHQRAERYWNALGSRAELLRAARGRVDLVKAVRELAGDVARRINGRVRTLLPTDSGDPTAADIRSLARGTAPALVVYSKDDPGLFHFYLHLPVAVQRRKGSLDWVIVEDADHTFRQPAAKARLHDLALGFILDWRRSLTARASELRRDAKTAPVHP